MHREEELIEAIPEHLSTVASVVKWGLLIALIVFWAGIQDQPELEISGLEVTRSQALLVACLFYIFTNFYALETFLKLKSIMSNVSDEHFLKAASKLTLHPWFANPFAHYGSGFMSNFNGSKGFGLLIMVWWIGNGSLYSLSISGSSIKLASPPALVVQSLFLAVGLASMLAIRSLNKLVATRLKSCAPEFAESFEQTDRLRTNLSILGILAGGTITFIPVFAQILA